jgi:hypothetical protein
MRRHAGKHLGDFNVPIGGRVREISQVGLIGHEHVRVVPTDDFAEKPWRQVNNCVKPVLRSEFEVPLEELPPIAEDRSGGWFLIDRDQFSTCKYIILCS